MHDPTRLQAALKQNEDDARAMLAALEVAQPLLSEATLEVLRERAKDILRMAERAQGDPESQVNLMKIRAQREDMMLMRIVELVHQRDVAYRQLDELVESGVPACRATRYDEKAGVTVPRPCARPHAHPESQHLSSRGVGWERGAAGETYPHDGGAVWVGTKATPASGLGEAVSGKSLASTPLTATALAGAGLRPAPKRKAPAKRAPKAKKGNKR